MPCSTQTCGSLKWPSQQVGVKSQCEVDASAEGQEYNIGAELAASGGVLRGIQSIGYDANMDPQAIFQIGQGAIYDTDEGLPTVDVTINKALDGYAPAFLALTKDAVEPTLLARAPTKSNLFVSYFDCTKDSARGTANSTVVFKDLQVTSAGYTFSVDGAFTEDISCTGNNIIWYTQEGANSPIYNGVTLSSEFEALIATISFPGYNADNDQNPNPKVQFKEDLIFTYDPTIAASPTGFDENGALKDPDTTILPQEVYGIDVSGLNTAGVCIQSISVSADLSREDLFCLGSRAPSNRTLTLPVQVDTTIEVVSENGGNVSFYENGVYFNDSGYGEADVCSNNALNTTNRTIRVATCAGTRISTGTKNFITGMSTQGASTGGENLAVTYTFRTYNVFTVMHPEDPSPSGSTWWSNRADYLCGN